MPRGDVKAALGDGAWADGASCRKVISGLAERGVNARAASVPVMSSGEDIAVLDRALQRIEQPVVLVGDAQPGKRRSLRMLVAVSNAC